MLTMEDAILADENTQATTEETPNPPVDESGNEAPFVDPTTGVVPAPVPTTPEPSEAYKGLQRTLEKEKARTRELEGRLQQMTSQPASTQDAEIVSALLREIAQNDPDRAQALSLAYNQYRLAAENQSLRNRGAVEENQRLYNEAQARNMQELRATAQAFGVDPDSAAIDYGDADTESIAERLARVRASATAAAAAAKPVTPPARVQADGTAHNTQPGSPPTPPSRNAAVVTDEQLAAANDAYARTYQSMDGAARAAAEAHLRDLTDRYAKQIFA